MGAGCWSWPTLDEDLRVEHHQRHQNATGDHKGCTAGYGGERLPDVLRLIAVLLLSVTTVLAVSSGASAKPKVRVGVKSRDVV